MKQEDLIPLIITAIQGVAPELTIDDIDADADLREECDLDSMDFLNVIIALKKLTGVSIPDHDYNQLGSLNKVVEYLQRHQ